MYRFLIVTCLLVICALVAVLALSSAEPQACIRLVNGAEVHNLDPARMTWMHDIRTAYGLWEPLLTRDPRTLAPVPGVAREFTVSDDGLTYTFHLRADAKWSNGDPVTAEDFRFAWFRVLDPATTADYHSYLLLIDGAGEYYNAMKAALDNPDAARPDQASVAIEVVDPHTLRVRLVSPTAYFPELVAFPTLMPVHRPSMERALAEDPLDRDGWLKPGRLVSNGPFTLEKWEFQYRLVLVRNEHYWDRANVPSRRIELLANPDTQTAFLSYESGAVDIVTNLPEVAGPELIRRSRAGQRDDVHVFPVWGTYYYRFNCRSGPLADVRVRQALTMTVDRQAIVEHITRRGERAQTSFVTPGIKFFAKPGQFLAPGQTSGNGWMIADEGKAIEYVPADGLDFDPAAARKLLADAGFGPGGRPFINDDGQPVSVLINESTAHKDIAEAVIKGWRDRLGLDIRLEIQNSNIVKGRLRNHKFDISRSGWFTDYADPTGFLTMFVSTDGNNDGKFVVAEYDELLKQAERCEDPIKRFELIRQAERILLVEQTGAIPIYQYVGQFLYRSAVTGIWPNPKQMIMLKGLNKR